MLVTPVTLPPGRLRLVTRPAWTGSAAVPKTIGMVAVAALAANAAALSAGAARTATWRRIRSAANSGSRSRSLLAQRYSIATLRPGFGQAATEGRHPRCRLLGRTSKERTDHRHRLLLRARRERPRRRAAERGQQLPPSNGDCHTPLPREVRKGNDTTSRACSLAVSRREDAGCCRPGRKRKGSVFSLCPRKRTIKLAEPGTIEGNSCLRRCRSPTRCETLGGRGLAIMLRSL